MRWFIKREKTEAITAGFVPALVMINRAIITHYGPHYDGPRPWRNVPLSTGDGDDDRHCDDKDDDDDHNDDDNDDDEVAAQ